MVHFFAKFTDRNSRSRLSAFPGGLLFRRVCGLCDRLSGFGRQGRFFVRGLRERVPKPGRGSGHESSAGGQSAGQGQGQPAGWARKKDDDCHAASAGNAEPAAAGSRQSSDLLRGQKPVTGPGSGKTPARRLAGHSGLAASLQPALPRLRQGFFFQDRLPAGPSHKILNFSPRPNPPAAGLSLKKFAPAPQKLLTEKPVPVQLGSIIVLSPKKDLPACFPHEDFYAPQKTH